MTKTIQGDNQHTNAEFIVKAVNCHEELVEALKEALKELHSYHENYSTADKGEIFTIIKQALAKAEGKG